MNIEITRRIKFCAGHRLMNHGGKCENLHGHNYLVDVTISANQTDRVGRVVDFAVVKKLFKGWFDENWDHGFILWEEDRPTIEAIQKLDSKLFLLPDNPTAENMAAYVLNVVGPKLVQQLNGYEIQVSRVAVWETEESCAEARLDSKTAGAESWLQSAHFQD